MLVRLIPLLLLIISCEETLNTPEPPDRFLELWCDLEMDGDVYVFNYDTDKSNQYSRVYYRTNQLTRVFWYSPNEFYVIMFNDTIYTPSINYSTYSDETDGTGLQLFYMNQQFLGDTLKLYGYLDEDLVKMVKVLVKKGG
jgi:hypothetical protein